MERFAMELIRPNIVLLLSVFPTILWAASALADSPTQLPIDGEWQFRLDPDDAGERERWFTQDLPDRLKLPGSLQEQGFGEEPSVETKWTTRIGGELLSQPKYAPYQKP